VIKKPNANSIAGVLSRLCKDQSGNTIAIMAAAVIPVLGLIGGAVDMGRIYVVQSRLQSACDAGALMGRRTMGTGQWADRSYVANTRALELFDANFTAGSYGSTDLDRSFSEAGGVVTGSVNARLDMTLMRALGQDHRDITVTCKAEMRMPASDIMFVLDTTGSMDWNATGGSASSTNPSRISGLRTATRCFYEAVTKKNIADVTPEACGETADPSNANSDVRIRFGFVPYSVNVNVGHLLPLDYIANNWSYQSRNPLQKVSPLSTYTLGTESPITVGTPGAAQNTTTNNTAWSDYGANLVINGTTNFPSQSVPNSTTNCNAYTANVSSYRPASSIVGDWTEASRTPTNLSYPTSSQQINYIQNVDSYNTEFSYRLDTQTSSVTTPGGTTTTYALVCKNNRTGSMMNQIPSYVTVANGPTVNTKNVSASATVGNGNNRNTCIKGPQTVNLTSSSDKFTFSCDSKNGNHNNRIDIECYGQGTTVTNPPVTTTTTTKSCVLQSRQINSQRVVRNASSTVPVTWNLAYQFDKWRYENTSFDVSALKDTASNRWNSSVSLPIGNNGTARSISWNGCVEERKTSPILDNDPSDDWDPIPDEAIDMDIERAPDPALPETQWGPSLKDALYPRFVEEDNNDDGYWDASAVKFETTSNSTNTWMTFGDKRYYATTKGQSCPTKAQQYKVWSPTDFSSYVGGLQTGGNTYHDIGLLWGARMMAPNGIFSAITNDAEEVTERHMIFMTDGDTNAGNQDYSAYGMAWWDRRQNDPSSAPADTWLESNIDGRTAAICKWVKDQNITLWVVGYGTTMTEATENRLKACATSGRYFKANDTATLLTQFKSIASQISALRMTQ
jgi:Flp pilus assembly protein TadG